MTELAAQKEISHRTAAFKVDKDFDDIVIRQFIMSHAVACADEICRNNPDLLKEHIYSITVKLDLQGFNHEEVERCK